MTCWVIPSAVEGSAPSWFVAFAVQPNEPTIQPTNSPFNHHSRPLLDHLHRFHMIRFLAQRIVGDAEEVRGELKQWRGDLLLASDTGGDADVLVEQRQAEGARKGAGQHALGEEIHRRVGAAAGRVDDVERDVGLHPGLREGGEAFGGAPDMYGEEGVVHRLERVAGADVAAVDDLLAERLEHSAHSLEQRGVASDHDGERPLLRSDRAAADGRIEKSDTMLAEPGSDAARRHWVAGGTVHERRTTS